MWTYLALNGKLCLKLSQRLFFDKYLTQYPGDIRASQPVVVFSHKPVSTLEDVAKSCTVLDVAIIPDKPGTCVAVTETFHDVASYHLLHAQKQADGQFSLTPNSITDRNLPSESSYATARTLLLDYFTHAAGVVNALKGLPKLPPASGNLRIGCFLMTDKEVHLFKNSLASFTHSGGDLKTVFAVTQSGYLNKLMSSFGVKLVYIPATEKVGQGVDPDTRRSFLQAWMAFAAADGGHSVLWQSPGTIWLSTPAKVAALANKEAETFWMYRGRDDRRASPFFSSFDFFWANGKERSVHLLHEVLLHADLLAEWKSLDAVAAYRLSENNARYGTTLSILPPHEVVHSKIVGNSAAELLRAASSATPPLVIVPPAEGQTPDETKAMLQAAKMWLIEV